MPGQYVDTAGMTRRIIQASALREFAPSQSGATCLAGENPCTGERFRMGILQVEVLKVVWSLREAMAPEKKKPAVRVKKAKAAG